MVFSLAYLSLVIIGSVVGILTLHWTPDIEIFEDGITYPRVPFPQIVNKDFIYIPFSDIVFIKGEKTFDGTPYIEIKTKNKIFKLKKDQIKNLSKYYKIVKLAYNQYKKQHPETPVK